MNKLPDATKDIMEEYERQAGLRKRKETAKDAFKAIFRQANGSGSPEIDGWREAFGEEHPTLVGTLAKHVGWGVLYRAIGRANAAQIDNYIRFGYESVGANDLLECDRLPYPGVDRIKHPMHDGRIDCSTIIGARLMALQSFI